MLKKKTPEGIQVRFFLPSLILNLFSLFACDLVDGYSILPCLNAAILNPFAFSLAAERPRIQGRPLNTLQRLVKIVSNAFFIYTRHSHFSSDTKRLY